MLLLREAFAPSCDMSCRRLRQPCLVRVDAREGLDWPVGCAELKPHQHLLEEREALEEKQRQEAADLIKYRRSLVQKARPASVLKKEPFKPQIAANRATQARCFSAAAAPPFFSRPLAPSLSTDDASGASLRLTCVPAFRPSRPTSVSSNARYARLDGHRSCAWVVAP